MSSDARALIIEFVNADQFPGRISQLIPFLRGYFAKHEVPARWVRFGMPTTHLLEHESDAFTLSPDELERVLGIARELRPTLVLTTDPLQPEQMQAITEAAGAPQVHFAPAYPGLPGAPFVGTRSLEDPAFLPMYAWEPGNEGAQRREVDNIYIDLRERCGHPRPACEGEPYAALTDARVRHHRGCTFCTNWLEPYRPAPSAAPPIESTRKGWVARQVQAIADTRPGNPPHALLLTAVPHASVLQECVDAMHAAGLCADVKLLAGVRTDQASWFCRVLRERFQADPQLKAGVYASGIESFDDRELALFNKGTRSVDGMRAILAFRELARDFPDRFEYTGLTFVLLTPWTTLESLRLNLGVMRLWELTGKELGNVFQARLRLHPELPITALAEHDGLIEQQEPDGVLIMNRRKLFGVELPWRFADPRLRPLSRLFMRYDLLQSPLADELARAIEQRVQAANPGWQTDTDAFLQELTACQIDTLLGSDDVPEPEALLDASLALWTGLQGASRAPAIHRIGEEQVSLETLVARIAPLISGGLRPVLAIRDVDRSELTASVSARLQSLGLVHDLVNEQGRPSAKGKLLLSCDRKVLERRVALEGVIRDDAEAVIEAGGLHGYPECCVQAHARSALAGWGQSAWALLAARSAAPGPAPQESMTSLLVPAAGFVPCSPGCAAAAEQWRRTRELLELSLPAADSACVFSLGARGDGELCILHAVSVNGDEMTHQAQSVQGAGRLAERVRVAPVLRMAPGQLRLVRDGRVRDALTATHGLWWSERAFHAEAWQTLAAGLGFTLRHRVRAAQAQKGPGERSGPGVVTWMVSARDVATGAEYVFRIARDEPGLPCFRRVGSLVLWYEFRELTGRAAVLAKVLMVLMQAMQREGVQAAAEPAWRAGLERLLARARLTASLRCEIKLCAPSRAC